MYPCKRRMDLPVIIKSKGDASLKSVIGWTKKKTKTTRQLKQKCATWSANTQIKYAVTNVVDVDKCKLRHMGLLYKTTPVIRTKLLYIMIRFSSRSSPQFRVLHACIQISTQNLTMAGRRMCWKECGRNRSCPISR